MYVFGGKDDENNKLDDLWKFNFLTKEWTEIRSQPDQNIPCPRSGHTASVYKNDYILIFGGIYEVTKELNDLFVFDMHKENWICLFEEINSPVRPNLVNLSSPGLLHKSKSVLA
jgi:hypothetical protein